MILLTDISSPLLLAISYLSGRFHWEKKSHKFW